MCIIEDAMNKASDGPVSGPIPTIPAYQPHSMPLDMLAARCAHLDRDIREKEMELMGLENILANRAGPEGADIHCFPNRKISVVPVEYFEVADPERLHRTLGDQFFDLVKVETKSTFQVGEQVIAMVADGDHPLAQELRAAIHVTRRNEIYYMDGNEAVASISATGRGLK
jgi:hypothetical protein